MDTEPQQTLLLLEIITRLEVFLRVCLVLFFSIAMFLDAIGIYWWSKKAPWLSHAKRIARVSFLIGVLFSAGHFTVLLVFPQSTVLSIVLSGLASVIAVVALVIERDKLELRPLKFLMGAIIWALTVITPFLNNISSPAFHSLAGLSLFHIATALAGEALCLVAFSSSLLYLWDYGRLKSRLLERSPYMPSLETLDKILGRTSMIGFLLISTSLTSGFMLILNPQMRAQLSELKLIWAFAVWGWYLLALVGRSHWGWTGRRGAHLSIWGTLLLGFALFGTIWNISGQGH